VSHRRHWSLDPAITFLNHGSFGAAPDPVLDHQRELQRQMEAEPVRFFVRELPDLIDAALQTLARFVGADAGDLVFVPNVTTAINAVLRSLPLASGDELLTTDHEYSACRNALDFAAQRAGARVVVAEIPFPTTSPDAIIGAVTAAITDRTRLLLVDHVTSPTALVLPIEQIVRRAHARGVPVMIDGAHAPGMIPLDLDALGADYYGANCHKWICAPKGAGFLHVRRDLQPGIRPLVISHGATDVLDGRSRFQADFHHGGTDDPTAWLCVPTAIRFMGSLLTGGWDAVMSRNRDLALTARTTLCDALGAPPSCPEAMLGSMATVPLPDGDDRPPPPPTYTDPLQDDLLQRFGIEVPVVCWPRPPHRLVRISAPLYNALDQYRVLGEALRELLPTSRAAGRHETVPQ